MRWWTVPALLLAFVAGYLLGTMSAGPEAGHAARAPVARDIPALPAAPPPLPTGVGESAQAHDAAPLEVILPDRASTAGEDADPEQGTLVVDFNGFEGSGLVRLESTDVEGNYNFMEQYADEDVQTFYQLAPGQVVVRWESRGAMRRFAARARIEAGRVTLLRAADPRHVPLPDPPGLAVLDVRVAGPDGQALPDTAVHLGGAVLEGQHWVSVAADAEGRVRFRVRGGSYEVQAGSRTEKVSIEAGERRTLELGHDTCGMVVVNPRLEGMYSLPARDGGSSMEPGYHDGSVRFLFVPAGSYELWYDFSSAEFVRFPAMGNDPGTAGPDRRLLATLEVRPGRAERIEHRPEPGFLEVEVDAPAPARVTRWQMRVSRQGDEGSALDYGLASDGGALRARTGAMPKGKYNVEILADGRVVGKRNAIVAHGRTQLDVKLH